MSVSYTIPWRVRPCGALRTARARVPSAAVPHVRVSTEVTFGRGDHSVCPRGGVTGRPRPAYRRSVPPGVPTGTHTKGTSPQGHFCAPLICAYLRVHLRRHMDISLSLSLSLSIYIYIYVYIYTCVCIYTYIYIYIYMYVYNVINIIDNKSLEC